MYNICNNLHIDRPNTQNYKLYNNIKYNIYIYQ